MIVKIPEIIGTLGIKEGMRVLFYYFPELVKYYEQVNRKIQSYIDNYEQEKEFFASIVKSPYAFYNNSTEKANSKQEVPSTENVSLRN